MQYFTQNTLIHELAKSLFIKLITGELGEDTDMLKHNCYLTAYRYYNEEPSIEVPITGNEVEVAE